MKNFSFSIFNIASIFSIIVLIILIVAPFNLINLEQAQRIAKWKADYDKIEYCFKLVNIHEGSIIPSHDESEVPLNEEIIWQRISPYLNLETSQPTEIKGYKYRKMNGLSAKKSNKYIYDKFIKTQNNIIYGLKKNQSEIITDGLPQYYLFVDINAQEKPNRIGQDIFFINIYKHHISALGSGKTLASQKLDCSPIGRGLYCSEYYLYGGRF